MLTQIIAQPQRPLRATRVYGDENGMIAAAAQKTIHQRNKSSPALSTMATAGGLKAAAKRTAFGDVSNTANTLRPSKDDSFIGNKGQREGNEKLAPLQQEKKTTALLRPAQRPLTGAGLKSLLTAATQTAAPAPDPVPAVVKQPLAEVLQPAPPVVQAANSRKILTKRSTAVFKDQIPALDAKIESNAQISLPTNGPGVPLHREIPPQIPQPSLLEEPASKLRKTTSKVNVKPELKHDATDYHNLLTSSDEPATFRSDGVYIDDNGHIQLYHFDEDVEAPQVVQQHLNDGVALPRELESEANDKILGELGIKANNKVLEKLSDEQLPQMQPPRSQKHEVAAIIEPEEYWDDEEDDNYEEEGYVTARSYRSRGENTTNGATTILFPKINLKTKKELAAAKAWMEAAKAANEVDDETWDTTMVAEYGDEIFQYMRELEVKMLPNAHYMDNQAEIQWSMRAVLMDWLVQVHQRFGLLPETLFLCCNYIDRFLSCKIVSLGKLQLVGATAIFVAAKYEEINCPSVQEIVYMVDNGYTVDEILKAERFMLSMLQFELGWPGPMSFLRRISKADDYDLETRTVAKYFLEITIMDERFVGSPPSFVAAGAHCLARMMLKKGHWVSKLIKLSYLRC